MAFQSLTKQQSFVGNFYDLNNTETLEKQENNNKMGILNPEQFR